MAETIIKNSARNSNSDTAEHEKYVPQYRILGISPEEKNYPSSPTDNHSTMDPGFLNVGNNEDLSWTKLIKSESDKRTDDVYFLLSGEQLLLTGTLEEIQKAVDQIFYQEHNTKNLKFSVDDLVVLKKMKIKIGIFVE